jgi:hypothetical protein
MPYEFSCRRVIYSQGLACLIRIDNKPTSAVDGWVLDVTDSVAAGATQREGFERGQLAVRPDHVIVSDLDRGDAAAL